ncbi:aldo/keto reductase [Alsobacter sp. SYSU M60028]|uniref:Aldo/keto reductase n=1 Tax=Alsobacter ponti TaxID=2962936 RepID=A0ABT1L9B3_9HYPH|nr:aldo/keto reductase [Alsobacter ponti]MCP8937536.1 aldo/keto reductase [Alsobacter ponti]
MIETVELAPDYRVSRIVRGGWQLHAAATPDIEAEAAKALRFVEAGVTAFETSDTYRHVDAALALALDRRRAAGLPLPRVHARLTLPCDVSVGRAAIAARLGLPTLDLVQLQSWALDEDALAGAALRLREEAAAGRLRHFGLMNIGEDTLERLLRRGVRPLTLQAQLSLLDRRALPRLAEAARAEGVSLLAYGTLAGGFLHERWLGRPDPGARPTAATPFHAEYRAVIEAFGGWGLYQELLAALASVAARHGARVATVATRWALDQPNVAAALVGSSDPARAREWADIFALRLDDADRARLDAVLARSEGPTGQVGGLERDGESPLARAIAASRASVA